MEVTVGVAGSAVLIMVCVVIDGSDGGVDVETTVTVGAGAVTVCMLALSGVRPPMIAEIAAVTDVVEVEVETVSIVEVGLPEDDAVIVIVTGSIVGITVLGPAWFAVNCTGQPVLKSTDISYSRRRPARHSSDWCGPRVAYSCASSKRSLASWSEVAY